MHIRPTLILLFSMLLFSCGSRAQKPITVFDFGPAGFHQSKLTHELREVSGLTVTDAGHLLAHDDEKGVIYRIDPMNGKLLSRFHLGRTNVHEDFEDIAAVGEYLYLVTSDGRLFYFREGGNDERVDYNVLATSLSRKNNVEGLAYDRDANALLLACKDSPGPGFPGKRAVYSFYLTAQRFDPIPRFLIEEKSLKGYIEGKHFKPSAIARHPLRFTWFILASDGRSLVELDGAGRILGLQRLDPVRHPQPEGLAFLPNGDMLISDEEKKVGTLTVYFYREEKRE
ncbi:MAG: hypothetical protein WBQ23_10855 [Bacteroidota bacterium]